MKNHRRDEAEVRRLTKQLETEKREYTNTIELLLFFLPLIIILIAIVICR